VRDQWDNLNKIRLCHSPIFIAHGTADRVVPFSHGERLFAAANEPKQFFPMVGYDHKHSPGPDFYETLRRFLDEHPTAGAADAAPLGKSAAPDR
jgi:fermentation-respiration switch protein FrsA (DUF1100 family)